MIREKMMLDNNNVYSAMFLAIPRLSAVLLTTENKKKANIIICFNNEITV